MKMKNEILKNVWYLSLGSGIILITLYIISQFHPLSGLFYIGVSIFSFGLTDIFVNQLREKDKQKEKEEKRRKKKISEARLKSRSRSRSRSKSKLRRENKK